MNMRCRVSKPPSLNCCAVTRGDDRYIFLWIDSQHRELLRVLGRWASDEELSFRWSDARKVAQEAERIRRPA